MGQGVNVFVGFDKVKYARSISSQWKSVLQDDALEVFRDRTDGRCFPNGWYRMIIVRPIEQSTGNTS